jgi:hypothetical protein
MLLLLGISSKKEEPKVLHYELKEKNSEEKTSYSATWFCQSPTFKDSKDDPPQNLRGHSTIVHNKNIYLYGGNCIEKINRDVLVLYTGYFLLLIL